DCGVLWVFVGFVCVDGEAGCETESKGCALSARCLLLDYARSAIAEWILQTRPPVPRTLTLCVNSASYADTCIFCRGGPPWPPGVIGEIESRVTRTVGMLWCLEIEFNAGRPRRAAPTVRSAG